MIEIGEKLRSELSRAVVFGSATTLNVVTVAGSSRVTVLVGLEDWPVVEPGAAETHVSFAGPPGWGCIRAIPIRD